MVNALAPAEVTKVVLDDEARRVEVVVPDDQLSLAIGRRGQNVRLASQLTRWDIDILTEAEESERRQEEFRKRSGLFVEALDVDDVIAGLLVTEGFTSVEDIISVEDEELAGIEGFDESVSAELKRRKVATLEAKAPEVIAAGNIGCMMQIGSGTAVPVVHTVELIDWATGGPMPRKLAGRDFPGHSRPAA